MSDLQPGRSASGETDELETKELSEPHARVVGEGAPVGSSVSRYVIIEELGRGGMGRVLRAYDPKLQREVAIKEVRRDRLDEEATVRLIAEARAMAKLSHRNVVAVYDVEELDRHEVVLVMEYVAGQTLRDWVLEADRDWRTIVERFSAAGQGLAAAHGAGLLHRDFKPANVLVADAAVKVTDFGLAKVARTDSYSSSIEGNASSDGITEAGMVMGTPRYMAPEQHAGRELTPAADQYSFCVALWEALSGRPPFSGESMAADKAAGPPEWPRATTPRPVVEAVIRGLSPEPTRRWPSMDHLLDALSWDPSRRRNRVLFSLGAVAALAAAAGGYQAWLGARAQRCSGAQRQLTQVWDETRRAQVQSAFSNVGKTYADEAWRHAEQAIDGYAEEWIAMHTEACEATAVRGEQSPRMMDLRMACLHRATVELGATIDVLADADENVAQRAHILTAELRPLARCADTEALAAEVEPPAPAEKEAVEAARSQLADARSLTRAGRYPAARAAVEEARTTLRRIEYGPVQTEVELAAGDVFERLGDYDASEAALVEALRLASFSRQYDAALLAATSLMYVVGDRKRQPKDALLYRPLAEGLSQGDPQAEASFRHHLGNILRAQGKYAEAEAEHRAALELREASPRSRDLDVAVLRNNLAVTLREQGKLAEAEAEHRAVLTVRKAALGTKHPELGTSIHNLANVLYKQGKYAEAEAEFRSALTVWEASLDSDHPKVAKSYVNLANVLAIQGKFAEAEKELRVGVALLQKSLGETHPQVAAARSNLGNVLLEQGKLSEAVAEQRGTLAALEATLEPDHPHLAFARHNLANTLVTLERSEEALTFAEQAWKRRQQDDVPPEQRGQTAFLLAGVLWIGGSAADRPRARRLAEDALASFKAAEHTPPEHIQLVETWLAEHTLP